MLLRTPSSAFVLLLAASLLPSCASDEVHRSSQEPAAPVDMEAMMAEMVRLGTPGEEHARLVDACGSWDVEGAFYMEPGGEPTPTKASAEITSLLGGRMTQETYRSEFMGMPFEGLLLQGYDNLKQHYWAVWYDNLSTWGMQMTGNYEEQDTLVLEGTAYDCMSPDGRTVRMVLTEQDSDHVNMKMYDVAEDGSTNLTMDLNYTRQ